MSKPRDPKNLVVGLDIGTSKIVCIVAEINDEGALEIIGMGTHPSRGLRRGVVVNIEATGDFVVNVVPDTLAQEMNETAADFPHGTSEFVEAKLTPVPAAKVKAPRLQESPIHFACERYEIVQIGPDGVGGGALVLG